jgi:hypothetical protein
MASAKSKLTTEVLSGKIIEAEKSQSFAAAASASKQEDSSSEEDEGDKDKKSFMNALWPLGNHLKKIRKRKRINANIVIIILATLSNTIQHLLKF